MGCLELVDIYQVVLGIMRRFRCIFGFRIFNLHLMVVFLDLRMDFVWVF